MGDKIEGISFPRVAALFKGIPEHTEPDVFPIFRDGTSVELCRLILSTIPDLKYSIHPTVWALTKLKVITVTLRDETTLLCSDNNDNPHWDILKRDFNRRNIRLDLELPT